MTKDEALRLALEALEMSDICADDCKCTRKRAINGIKAALEAKDEPFEYWNAVEGWVKIEEVRDHFDSVGCGTIYKTSGEDRVPLYTTPPQRKPLTDEEIEDAWASCEVDWDDKVNVITLARAIEAAHGIKGEA